MIKRLECYFYQYFLIDHITPHSKICMIQVDRICTLYAFSCTIQSGISSVKSPNRYYATNVAWQDHIDNNKIETLDGFKHPIMHIAYIF